MLAPKSFRKNPLYRFKGIKPKVNRPTHPSAVTEQGVGFPYRKSSPTNILFRYLYRDCSNHKQHGEAIFNNHTFLSLPEIEKKIRACLKDGKFFIARQVNIEERFFDVLHGDDHPWWNNRFAWWNNRFAWHEFERVETTNSAPFDPDNWTIKQHRRDISEFLDDLEIADRNEWDESRVRADVVQLLERQKVELTQGLNQNT